MWCGQGGFGGIAATLLDTKTHGVRTLLPGPDGYLSDLVFDAGHKWALGSFGAGAGNKFQGVALWDTTNLQVLALLPTTKRCESIAINSGRPQFAWCEVGSVHLHNVETGEDQTIDLKDQSSERLLFSPDGMLLAIQASPISVWDAKTGQHLRDLPSTRDNPPSEMGCERVLDIDEQGRILAVGVPNPAFTKQKPQQRAKPLIRLAADMKTWETVIADLEQHGRMALHAAALSPDRRWLAIPEQNVQGGGAERIDIWDTQTGARARSLAGHWNHIGQLTFSGDSRLLASISRMGGVIKIWTIEDVVAGSTSP